MKCSVSTHRVYIRLGKGGEMKHLFGAVMLAPLVLLISGCAVAEGVLGIEFVPSYSPEQQEVFLTTLDSVFAARDGENTGIALRNRETFLDFGYAICEALQSEPREAVLDSMGRLAATEFPTLEPSSIRRMGETFLLASTAQGSLCP